MREITISLLHLALQPGLLAANLALVERGVRTASAAGADWVFAPELCISGYLFADVIGTGWIAYHPDQWTKYICGLAKSCGVVICFGHAERDRACKFYNSAFIADPMGAVVGHHRKINTLAESWASSGRAAEPVTLNGVQVGMLICADAYKGDVAQVLLLKGAQMLISPAAWAPGLNGPQGEWEQRTVETGLPLIVCNRTGSEGALTFDGGESLVIKNGRRLLSHSSRRSAVLTFSWNLESMRPASKEFAAIYL